MSPSSICIPVLLLSLLAEGSLVGCRQVRPQDDVAVTRFDLLNQPAVASVESESFSATWDAWTQTLRQHGLRLDRTDYRGGILTTEPTVSQQPGEFWLQDVATPTDAAVSAAGTVRRVIVVRIIETRPGQYRSEPRVVIERQSQRERGVTVAQQWKSALSAPLPRGNREADAGLDIPDEYWYPLRRDPALERALAERASRILASGSAGTSRIP